MTSKRDNILDAALLLFSQQGIASTSTAQIAKQAGVAKGTLFHHFESKSELVDQLFAKLKLSLFSQLFRHNSKQIATDTDPSMQWLREVWVQGLQRAQRHPQEVLFFAQVQSEQLNSTRLQVLEETFEPVEQFIVRAQQLGVLPELPLTVIRDFAHSHFVSVATRLTAMPEGASISAEEYIEYSFGLFWRALGGEYGH